MNVKDGGVLGIVVTIMMIVGIIMANPTVSQATLLAEEHLFNDQLVLSVIAEQVADQNGTGNGDADWKFWYHIQSNGVNLYQLNIGTILPGTTTKYTLVGSPSYHIPDYATFPQSRLGLTSLVVYFLPSGLDSDAEVSDLWIIYEDLIGTQSITITAAGSGGTATIRPDYTGGGYTPVPEPGTLLMLGSGMITLWFLSRRKRRI